MADWYECCKCTIRSRLKELKKNGHSIIHSAHGVSLFREDRLSKEEFREGVVISTSTMIGIQKRLAEDTTNIEKHIPAIVKAIGETMTDKELTRLEENLVKLTMAATQARIMRLITYKDKKDDAVVV